MKQIRYSVFETNSSSTHSLVIMKNDILSDNNTPIYTSDEEIKEEMSYHFCRRNAYNYYTAYNEDWYYGRAPYRVLSTFWDKVKYALASYYVFNGEEFLDSSNLRDLCMEFLSTYFHNLSIKLPVNIGVDENFLDSWLKKYNITIEEFCKNNKYVVICDGDEYNIFYDFVRAGLFDYNAADNACDIHKQVGEQI